MSGHVCRFAALWSYYGQHGPQDKHYHVCYECGKHLVGDGRECDGKLASHPQYPAASAQREEETA